MGSLRLEVPASPEGLICVWWTDQEIPLQLLQEAPASCFFHCWKAMKAVLALCMALQ